MTEHMIALARRAVACKGWRWLRGMLRHDDYRYVGSGVWARWSDTASVMTALHMPDQLPDLTDPATRGCLLALVREAWRCPTVHVRQGTTRRVSDGVLAWEVCDLWLDAEACRALGVDRQGSVGSWGHGSEAEAIVAALEAAP
jgi:hypothetical protein